MLGRLQTLYHSWTASSEQQPRSPSVLESLGLSPATSFRSEYRTTHNDTMAPRKLNIAISGLGRMGARHATNFYTRTPRANVVAAFTPEPKEAEWAATNLPDVKIYNNYEEMLKHPGLEAVVVATVTTAHAEQAIKAIEADKHVLCEKPLSTSIDVVSTTV